MTHTDFRHTLDSLGLSQTGVSRVLGVSDRHVRRWIAGDTNVPEPIAKLLRLMATGRISVDDVRKA